MNDVLAAINRVLTLHAQSSLELSLPVADAEKRGPALLSALSSRGVAASRMKLAPSPGSAAPSADAVPAKVGVPVVELSFSAG